MIHTGLAVSDKILNDYLLTRLTGGMYNNQFFPKFELDAFELQVENLSWYEQLFNDSLYRDSCFDNYLKELKSKSFLSVHAPNTLGSISTLENEVRKNALKANKNAMDIANHLSAKIFVLHPCSFSWNYWQSRTDNYINLREKTKSLFLDSLRELCQYYLQKSFDFYLGLENLEFNQYPATSQELLNLLDDSRKFLPRFANKLGIVMDIQHLRHSQVIVKENYLDLKNHFSDYFKHYDYESFVDLPICHNVQESVLSKLFRENGKDIILIHLAGNDVIHSTHDPILYNLDDFVYSNNDYVNGRINIPEVLDIIKKSNYNGALIIESGSCKQTVEGKAEDMFESVSKVINYLK